jgi:hypothetical protein
MNLTGRLAKIERRLDELAAAQGNAGDGFMPEGMSLAERAKRIWPMIMAARARRDAGLVVGGDVAPFDDRAVERIEQILAQSGKAAA